MPEITVKQTDKDFQTLVSMMAKRGIKITLKESPPKDKK